jgi:uncharacterized OB-fold protein
MKRTPPSARDDSAAFDAALRLLTSIGAIELPPDYCRKCGREHQPGCTCPHCDTATNERNTT